MYLEYKGFYVICVVVIVYILNGGCSFEGLYMLFYVNIEGIFYIIDVGFGDLFISIIEIGFKI